eukprot:g6462.t1
MSLRIVAIGDELSSNKSEFMHFIVGKERRVDRDMLSISYHSKREKLVLTEVKCCHRQSQRNNRVISLSPTDSRRHRQLLSADIFLVFFSLLDPQSLQRATQIWLSEAKAQLEIQGRHLPPIVLVGTHARKWGSEISKIYVPPPTGSSMKGWLQLKRSFTKEEKDLRLWCELVWRRPSNSNTIEQPWAHFSCWKEKNEEMDCTSGRNRLSSDASSCSVGEKLFCSLRLVVSKRTRKGKGKSNGSEKKNLSPKSSKSWTGSAGVEPLEICLTNNDSNETLIFSAANVEDWQRWLNAIGDVLNSNDIARARSRASQRYRCESIRIEGEDDDDKCDVQAVISFEELEAASRLYSCPVTAISMETREGLEEVLPTAVKQYYLHGERRRSTSPGRWSFRRTSRKESNDFSSTNLFLSSLKKEAFAAYQKRRKLQTDGLKKEAFAAYQKSRKPQTDGSNKILKTEELAEMLQLDKMKERNQKEAPGVVSAMMKRKESITQLKNEDPHKCGRKLPILPIQHVTWLRPLPPLPKNKEM